MDGKEYTSLTDLIFITVTMLIGEEGVDFIFYETCPYWWAVRLWTRRN